MSHRIKTLLMTLTLTAAVAGGGAAMANAASSSSTTSTTSSATTHTAPGTRAARPGAMPRSGTRGAHHCPGM